MRVLPFIDGDTVRELLPMSRCVSLMAQAFRATSSGSVIQPIRQVIPVSRGVIMGWMPGALTGSHIAGLKVMTVGRPSKEGSHQGVVILFDAETGAPAAILDGAAITAIRTAAASAAATSVLSRPDVHTLTIFGSGEQARAHLQALPLVRSFERIVIWARDARKAEGLAEEMRPKCECAIGVEVSAKRAAEQADVLCTTTSAKKPILTGDWLRAGQHLNVIGSSGGKNAEVDARTLRRSAVFVDSKEAALALSAEIAGAAEGPMTEVGDVIDGRAAGRQSCDQITLFKSVGLAAQDLLAADYVWTRFLERS